LSISPIFPGAFQAKKKWARDPPDYFSPSEGKNDYTDQTIFKQELNKNAVQKTFIGRAFVEKCKAP
jgi:hypothetical protein